MANITTKEFSGEYDKKEFYCLMGESFALKSVRKELPYLDNEPGRVWFVAVTTGSDPQVAGFVSLQEESNKISFKNDFIYPAFRDKGLYRLLNNERMKFAERFNKPLLIIARKETANLFLELGFTVQRTTAQYHYLRKDK